MKSPVWRCFFFFDVNKIVDSSVFSRCQFSLMKIENTFIARPLDECDPTPPGSGRGYVLYLDTLIEDPSDLAGLTVWQVQNQNIFRWKKIAVCRHFYLSFLPFLSFLFSAISIDLAICRFCQFHPSAFVSGNLQWKIYHHKVPNRRKGS